MSNTSDDSASPRFSGLPENLLKRVLQRLSATSEERSVAHLQSLLSAYSRTVPWESASRIARRRRFTRAYECACWPEEFWRNHLEAGTGGTCFESNFALRALLVSLGYDVRLTINDMKEQRGCHSALVVPVDDARFIVDVGIPVHAPIPVSANNKTTSQSEFHTYTLTPANDDRFILERSNHPKNYVYTLNDTEVSESEYRDVLIADYEPVSGLFLDRIIINKVVHGEQHRFCSADLPPGIEVFSRGGRRVIPLGSEPAREVARVFGLGESVLRDAGLT